MATKRQETTSAAPAAKPAPKAEPRETLGADIAKLDAELAELGKDFSHAQLAALDALRADVVKLQVGLTRGAPVERLGRGVELVSDAVKRLPRHKGGSLFEGEERKAHRAVFRSIHRL
jgi:hypothetical protein